MVDHIYSFTAFLVLGIGGIVVPGRAIWLVAATGGLPEQQRPVEFGAAPTPGPGGGYANAGKRWERKRWPLI